MWSVFIPLKWIKFNIAWVIRFVAPYSTDAKIVQHTIQLIPRLTEPTLVTKVLVKPNEPVKKGQPLFQFDRRPYEYQVRNLQAQLAAAQQNVLTLKAQLDAASAAVAQAKAQQASLKKALESATAKLADARAKTVIARKEFEIDEAIAKEGIGAVSKLHVDQATAVLAESEAAVNVVLADEAQARVNYEDVAVTTIQIAVANETKARLAYTSEINGENTTVAQLKAQLAQAEYYLDNTTLVAPEDGRIMNLQVQEGMVAGIYRVGAIATFIVDKDRYLLGTYNQEVLKWVEDGQPVGG